ncbi:MAG: lactonase family protein [Planctomycetaceae bacterium]|nr:lactonase family protein [Planctomycetaceae bacterium]
MKIRFLAIIIGLLSVSGSLIAQETAIPFLIGTYTQGQFHGKGIYLSEFDPASGSMKPAELIQPCDAPAFLIRHPEKNNRIYAVGETWTTGEGPIHAFSFDPLTKRMNKVNDLVIPGTGPTHLCVHSDAQGESLVVACYGSGNTVSVVLEKDGRLGKIAKVFQHFGSGPNQNRQKGPHPHGAYVVPGTSQILIPDLGIDKVMMYDIDPATSVLTPSRQAFLAMPPGSGPRHLAFDPTNAARFYVVNELDSTVSAVRKDAAGNWAIVQTVSTLPREILADPEKLADLNNTTAEIAVHPSGRFVYASNRGHNSIAVFAVDKENDQLTLVQTEPTQGRTPRHFAIVPGGHFLLVANQDSDTVTAFQIDPESGKMVPLHQSLNVGSPVCVVF